MGDAYKEIGKRLAARRNVREFNPWREDAPDNGRSKLKDFLTGKEMALSKNGLGAMNLVKRTLAAQLSDKIGDYTQAVEKEDYLAVIAMDGDKMGKCLSSFESAEEHRTFSSQLAKFACSVREPIEKDFDGCLIYAGGDDVLAVVPATKAIACADAIQKIFASSLPPRKNSRGENEPMTMSAGIAVGHYKTPLQDVILAAHSAEHRAKHQYGRNALALSVFKRSGEILEWGCKWGSKGIELFELLATSVNKNRDKEQGADEGAVLSARFPYKLAGLLEPYDFAQTKEDALDRGMMQAVVEEELKFALKQSLLPKKEEKDIFCLASLASGYLKEVFTTKKEDGEGNETDEFHYQLSDFLNVFLCETFINRPRDIEDK